VVSILLVLLPAATGLALGAYGLLLALPPFTPRRGLVQNLSYPEPMPLPPKQAGALARSLRLLPLTRRWAPWHFVLLQAASGLAAGLLLSLDGHPPVIPLLLVAPAAALLPRLVLQLQIGRRQRLLLRAYPDLLAHLVTQLRAGAPTPTAFASAPPALTEPLRQEVVELLADLSTAPFPAALRRFTERCDLEPLRHLAAAVEQGEAVGISLLHVLEKEEAHALALARQAVRERIQTSAVILAAVTVVLLVNGLLIWFTPVAFDLLKLLQGQGAG
jgi:Flp pilus assembly protein TadB